MVSRNLRNGLIGLAVGVGVFLGGPPAASRWQATIIRHARPTPPASPADGPYPMPAFTPSQLVSRRVQDDLRTWGYVWEYSTPATWQQVSDYYSRLYPGKLQVNHRELQARVIVVPRGADAGEYSGMQVNVAEPAHGIPTMFVILEHQAKAPVPDVHTLRNRVWGAGALLDALLLVVLFWRKRDASAQA